MAAIPQNQLCSFCKDSLAAVSVRTEGSIIRRPMCLKHFYTTSMHRNCGPSTERIMVADKIETMRQLDEIQKIFAESYTELQRELSETLALDAERDAASSDPLSSLFSYNSGRRKSSSRLKSFSEKKLKSFEIDYRNMKRSQEQKLTDLSKGGKKSDRSSNGIKSQISNERKKIVNDGKSEPDWNPYKRRKSKSISYWSLNPESNEKKLTTIKGGEPLSDLSRTLTHCNFCGSIDVSVLGSALCREGSIKSEVWGSKERSSIQRYACGSCGKLWNEDI